jgi:hypothetical protein
MSTLKCRIESDMNSFIINCGGLKMKKFAVTLTEDERTALKQITSKGKHKSQEVINSLVLLGCDEKE